MPGAMHLSDATIHSTYTRMRILTGICISIALLGGLFFISRFNFLLFHVVAELFSISVAGAVFILAWNVAHFSRNDSMVFLGISYFYIGLTDLIHTLTYKGMNIFMNELGANPATQLWVAARGVEAVTLLVYPLLVNRRFRAWSVKVNLIYTGTTSLILASIFLWKIFPDCFIEGTGLTAFKITSEYVICAVLTAALVLLFRKKQDMDKGVHRLLSLSILITIMSETVFTLYIDVYGLANVLGHFLKIVSFFLIYLAFVRSSLIRPYTTIFRQLEQEKEALLVSESNVRKSEEMIKQQLREKETLLKEVHHRIKNNISSIKSLLTLQSGLISNAEAKSIINEALSRVESMYQIYQKLLLTEDYGELSVKEYLEDLVTAVINIYPEKEKVSVNMEIEDIPLNVKKLFPLGTIVNELITNSMKYAFAERESGSINIVVNKTNSTITVSIHDDGNGLPEDFDIATSAGFGSTLITMLTRQLGGTIVMENKNGTRCVVTFGV